VLVGIKLCNKSVFDALPYDFTLLLISSQGNRDPYKTGVPTTFKYKALFVLRLRTLLFSARKTTFKFYRIDIFCQDSGMDWTRRTLWNSVMEVVLEPTSLDSIGDLSLLTWYMNL
jgi:hypothetical protein